jgi:hypothetical protein
MTLTACARTWGPDTYNWASSAATDVGMRLHEAFSAFAAAANANPANADLQLSVLRNHASATGATNFGFVWRLGHPTTPQILSFHTVSLLQGSSASDSSALLRLGHASDWIDDTSNGGYGSLPGHLLLLNASAGFSHYGPTGTPLVPGLEGTLIVAFDPTPGVEFFLATVLRPGEDSRSLNLSILLFRSPGASGWCLLLHRSNALGGLFGSTELRSWTGHNPTFGHRLVGVNATQQLNAPIHWLPLPSANGPVPFNSIQPRLALPTVLWCGDNQHSDPRRLGRFTDPAGGGTFFQLGAAGGFINDYWLRVPSSPAPSVLSGWGAIGALSWRTVSDRLSVMALPPLAPSLIGPASVPDLVTDWSANIAGLAGVQQHPLYAQQLAAAGLGGGTGGGGGSGRPATGVLWPRRQ